MEAISFGVLTSPDVAGRRNVELVSLTSRALRVTTVSLGASLHTVEAPDRHGHHDQVCLSLTSLAELEDPDRNPHLGSTCGRYANRIAGASFELDGRRVVLERNDGPHHLHGGTDGFSRRVWEVAEVTPNDDGGRVVFALHSPAGEGGYPGAVDATATYELHGHHLRTTFEAVTDAPTVINLCNHAYWNLGGASRWSVDRSVADHELRIRADHVLPAGPDAIPVGPLAHVADARLDLRQPAVLHDLLAEHRSGLDHSFALGGSPSRRPDGLALAAELHHPPSGRTLTVATDQPAIHLYTGDKLAAPFARGAALCLETQRFPDAPNRPDLPSPVLRPGEHYRAVTELTFGVR